VGDGVGATDAVGATLVGADAAAEAEGDDEPDALPDPLGDAERLDSGNGVGDGNSVVGTFASASAKISTKMTTTIRIHGRARLSFFGGSAPR
jgi:hypothetical protein